MKLKIKDQIPDTEIFQLVDGEPQKIKLREKRVRKYFGICDNYY